jgi:hypothetical protein
VRWHRPHRASGRHLIYRRAAVLLLSGLSPIALSSAVLAQNAPVTQSIDDRGVAAFIAEASQRFSIPVNWIWAVMHAESRHVGDVSLAGAMGLMQIMPKTWSELRGRYQLGANPFDPHDNIIAGAAYLREMLDRYGSVGAMLAAYNAGPSRYDEYLATGHSLPAETRDYVAKLAPILGGKSLSESNTIATLRPTDWRDAPLFVVVADGGSPPGLPLSDNHSAATSVSTSTNGGDAPAASIDTIFVPIAHRRSTP